MGLIDNGCLRAAMVILMRCLRPPALSRSGATALHRVIRLVALLAVVVVCLPVRASVSDSDREMAQRVFSRLLMAASAPDGLPWPPELEIVDNDDVNAFASIRSGHDGGRTVVECYAGLMSRVIEGNQDRMAYVLAHELAHHLLGHTKAPEARTEFLSAAFTREQELQADRRGMELAMRSGFSYKEGLSAIRRMMEMGPRYSSFEKLAADHPAWTERMARLDREQETLWRAMTAFDNGVYFMATQNYPLAERAFRKVTGEFPDAYDAWANLGHAQLMQYTDALDEADLRHFDVGQIAAEGFYRRPQSLEGRVRGINEALWVEAVRSLERAAKLNPRSALARSSLGVAYLLRPAGKEAAKAAQLLEEAMRLGQDEEAVGAFSWTATEMNLAVAYAASGEEAKARMLMEKVQAALKEMDPDSLAGARTVVSALTYNHALLLARSVGAEEKRMAAAETENYLRWTSAASAWRRLAYERYLTLCRETGMAPKADAEMETASVRFRPVAGIEADGVRVTLGESMTEAARRLGSSASESQAAPGVTQADFTAMGIRLIGTQEVLAIALSGPRAPALTLREMGIASGRSELRAGMTVTELDRVMGDAEYDLRRLVDPEVRYRFYPDVGVAALVRKGRVEQLVVSQAARRRREEHQGGKTN